MNHLGRLVPHHLPLLQGDLVQVPGVVVDLQRPVRVHLLLDVQDGGDDVGPDQKHFHLAINIFVPLFT